MYGYAYRRRSASSWLTLPLLIPVLIVLAIVALQLTRGLPAPQVTTTLAESSVLGTPTQPLLPSGGSSLVAVAGLGTLGTAGSDQPRPIASITKVMTAWVLLKGHPLKPNESGPTLTLTDADARRYNQMILEDQSAIPVSSGMRLTQFQLMQGMLIASANNFAEILANWDAGSQAAFVAKMNAEAQAMGMSRTTYADTSGISPKSMSTPADQLILERKAMSDPVFRSIVGTKQTQVTGLGTLRAVNEILGQNGVIGIKTGYTEEAGGNLAFAAERTIGGAKVEIYGAIMGQTNRPAAFDATLRVIESLDKGLQVMPVLPAGQPVAMVKPPWGKAVDVITEVPAPMLVWPGMTMHTEVSLDKVKASLKAGTRVGMLVLTLGEQRQEVPLMLARDIEDAGLFWKLTRF
ncbi:MAG TPA: hypothetical protein VJB57_12415 [Dehalococcoidia bacterium]|nr:hypothetical protein [Dehalococcoidia bacterium]